MDILTYLPHRPPMVLVDDIPFWDEQQIRGQFTIPEDHIFVQNGKLNESGLIENMAQTLAAGTALSLLPCNEDCQPPIGFIGALRNVIIHDFPDSKSTIQTQINILHRIMNAFVVEGCVTQNGNILAEAELKIFINQ